MLVQWVSDLCGFKMLITLLVYRYEHNVSTVSVSQICNRPDFELWHTPSSVIFTYDTVAHVQPWFCQWNVQLPVTVGYCLSSMSVYWFVAVRHLLPNWPTRVGEDEAARCYWCSARTRDATSYCWLCARPLCWRSCAATIWRSILVVWQSCVELCLSWDTETRVGFFLFHICHLSLSCNLSC